MLLGLKPTKMPLVFRSDLFTDIAPGGTLGVWRIDEAEEELKKQLALSLEEEQQLANIKGLGRRREFLAARQLLHQLSGREERGSLIKDSNGKPHLAGSAFQVSISHTHQYSAAVGHVNTCGVDIQLFVAKINRIAPRFMNARELVFLTDANRLIFQHLVWSAKEAMYKCYGLREIDFRQHLLVDLAGIPLAGGRTKGYLQKDGVNQTFWLNYQIFANNYMLVAAVKEQEKP